MKFLKILLLSILLILTPSFGVEANAPSELEMLTARYQEVLEENKALKEDLKSAELVMLELNSIVHKMNLELEKSNSLRLQAELSLEISLSQISALEKAQKDNSKLKVSLMLGGIYHMNKLGAFAGFSISF